MTKQQFAPQRSEFGLVEWLRPGEYARAEALIADAARVRVSSIRTGISWAEWFTPEGPAWYEWLIPALAEKAEILPCFLYTPPSIAVAPKTSAPPVNPKDYADFLDVFVSRFGNYFEWVELWNEPNNVTEWDWTLDPHWKVFGEMIGAAAYWMKQCGKKTVLGGMSPIDGHWLCQMFALGVMPYIDAVGIHGFPDTFDYTWKGWQCNLEQVREVLDSYGSKAEIWITEAGFSTWQHDEREQIRKFLEFVDAPAARRYWYGLDDLDPTLPAVDRYHLDEREYYFGLKKIDGSRKLLFRLLEEGGVPLLRSFASDILPSPAIEVRPAERPVLITGGAGFIGTNLAYRLLAGGERVLIYDNLCRPGVEKNLLRLRERYGERVDVRIADTRNGRALAEAVKGCREVFHFAAQVAVTTSLVNPANDFEINARGTVNLLEAIRAQPNPPPLLFTSTNKVYGALPSLPLRRAGRRYEPEDPVVAMTGIGESMQLDFHSPYGCSKGCADQYVIDYARSYGLPMAVFRMSCIYGPHQLGTEDQGWVAHFLIRAIRGQGITIYRDGRQVRDILYVDDLVDAFLLARRNMNRLSGHAFNIGGGPDNTVSLMELLALIAELQGSVPEIEHDQWRTGDQKYYVSDTRSFMAATGWSARHDPRTGVALLYAWLLEENGLPVPAEFHVTDFDAAPYTEVRI